MDWKTCAAFTLILCVTFLGLNPFGETSGYRSANYTGRNESLALPGGASVHTFIPLVHAAPWKPFCPVEALVPGLFLAGGYSTALLVLRGVLACGNMGGGPKLGRVNHANVQLWYDLRAFSAAALVLPWLTMALSWSFSLRSAWPALCVAAVAAAAQACFERRALEGDLTVTKAWRSLLSKLETLDACTDGAAVVVALSMSDTAHHRFVESFRGSVLQTFGMSLVADRMGVGGLMFAVLCGSSVVQAASAASCLQTSGHALCYGEGGGVSMGLLADASGLGALAEQMEGDARSDVLSGDDAWNEWRSALARVASETAPQLVLQTSYLMATAQGVLAQPVLLFSVVMSCGTLLKRSVAMLAVLIKHLPTPRGFAIVGVYGWIIAYVNIVVWMRLYYSEACESREWGLTTGCAPCRMVAPQFS